MTSSSTLNFLLLLLFVLLLLLLDRWERKLCVCLVASTLKYFISALMLVRFSSLGEGRRVSRNRWRDATFQKRLL